MADQIRLSLLERHGWIEAFSRHFFENHPQIKKIIKKCRNKNTRGAVKKEAKKIEPCDWNKYKESIDKEIKNGDILLIHSSADGLAQIGVAADQFLDFLKTLVRDKACTIVMACFPITNLRPPMEKSRAYDPKKTLCWTGMLSNSFIAEIDCVRTRFPYNSLAAMGPKAEEMMEHDLDAKLVYDKNSAWRYCYDHHAKILFAGVKASCSNTMAIHMLPDFMSEEWPIEDWYEERIYKVKLDDKIIEEPVKVQKGFWYRYVMEEKTSGRLKIAGHLKEQNIGGCCLGIVPDCQKMLDYLSSEVRKGKLTYLIPRKYYKKK